MIVPNSGFNVEVRHLILLHKIFSNFSNVTRLLVVLVFLQSGEGFTATTGLFKDWTVGLEMGGAAAWMFSDIPTGVTGLGLGKQFSVSAITQREESFGLKFRIERALLNEESITRADTNKTSAGTLLKSMEQKYWLFGAGVEWRNTTDSQSTFWEVTTGYAYGTSGLISVENTSPDQLLKEIEVPLRSGIFVGGGGGIRKQLRPNLFLNMNLRTLFILNTIYSTGQYQSSSLIPIPFLINFGLEMPIR